MRRCAFIPTTVKCPGCSDRAVARAMAAWRLAGLFVSGAVRGKPRFELREPQATEARSFVGQQGPS